MILVKYFLTFVKIYVILLRLFLADVRSSLAYDMSFFCHLSVHNACFVAKRHVEKGSAIVRLNKAMATS